MSDIPFLLLFRNLLIVLILSISTSFVKAQDITFSNSTSTPYGGATPCNSPVIRTINVPNSLLITDVNVGFLAQHNWRTDTNLSVESPAGTVVVLLTGNFTQSYDNYNVIFDDDALVVVDTGTHVGNQSLTGSQVSVRSEADNLSDFNGEDAQGIWKISICDIYTPADNGIVQNISLIFAAPPELSISKSVDVHDGAIYAVSGNDVTYTVSVSNTGNINTDTDTVVIFDQMPDAVEFFNDDLDGAGALTNDPIAVTDAGSGLTFNYTTDVRFSNAATKPLTIADCTYIPIVGYDPDVTYICIHPKGVLAQGDPDPSISFQYRARIK